MSFAKRLLYFGQASWGCTSLQRFNALAEVVGETYLVDSRLVFPDKGAGRSIFKSIQGRIGHGPLIKLTEKLLLKEVIRFAPDTVWVDGGFLVSARILAQLKSRGIRLIHYTPDSISAPGMSNRCFRSAINRYDVLITTKSQDLDYYEKNRAKKTLFTYQGFDPSTHTVPEFNQGDLEQFQSDVVFVGHYMKRRHHFLEHLSAHSSANIALYGTGWDNNRLSPSLRAAVRGPAYGDQYAKAIRYTGISLGFLNTEVKDTFTTRTFEIPACGGFLLAERTPDHQKLFEEGVEAEFFDSPEELLQKTEYYLQQVDKRIQIAKNGQEKILGGKFSWPAIIDGIADSLS